MFTVHFERYFGCPCWPPNDFARFWVTPLQLGYFGGRWALAVALLLAL